MPRRPGKKPPGVDKRTPQPGKDLTPAPPPPPAPSPPPSSCDALLAAAEQQFASGHVLRGIEGLFAYVECVAKGGIAASHDRHAAFVESVRRKL